jgi:hypothetical protein
MSDSEPVVVETFCDASGGLGKGSTRSAGTHPNRKQPTIVKARERPDKIWPR